MSNATSPHVPILGRLWEPEGVARLGGVPRIQPAPILLWMGGLGSEASRVGWMCSSRLCFWGSCGGAGRQEGTGRLGVVSPHLTGVVGCGTVCSRGGSVASGSHAGPEPDPGQEEVTRIWGEKRRGGVRDETGVRAVVPTTCPHVGTRSHGQLPILGDRDLLG